LNKPIDALVEIKALGFITGPIESDVGRTSAYNLLEKGELQDSFPKLEVLD